MATRNSTRKDEQPGAVSPLPAAPPITPEPQSPVEDATDPKDKLDFFEYLRTLNRVLPANSLIYLYRLEPKIKNKSDRAYIDKISAEGVDEDWVKQKHGGGKYQGYLSTGNAAMDVKRVFWIEGPAIIRPDQIMVDHEGNAIPAAAPAPASEALTKSDLLQSLQSTLQTVLEAVKNKDVNAGQALGEMMSLMKQAAAGAVDIATSSAKQQVTNPSGSGLESVVRDLLQELKNSRGQGRETSRIDKFIDVALEKMLNPAPAADMFDQLKKLADLGNMEGLGFLKTLFGGGQREESFWEKAGAMVAEGLATAIKENGPAIVQAYREKLQVDHARIVLQGRDGAHQVVNVPPGHQPAPMPPTHQPPLPNVIRMPSPPAGPGSAPSPQPPPMPRAQEEQVAMQSLVTQITNLIATCWDEGDSGRDTAITVKRSFKPLVSLLQMNFKDLEQLKNMAKTDAVLSSISDDPDFPAFAQEFFDELHAAGPAPGAGDSA